MPELRERDDADRDTEREGPRAALMKIRQLYSTSVSDDQARLAVASRVRCVLEAKARQRQSPRLGAGGWGLVASQATMKRRKLQMGIGSAVPASFDLKQAVAKAPWQRFGWH